jgi:RecB family exonuclease
MTPTPRLIQISAWSYSRYQKYTQCPFLAKCLYITKLKEPDSPAGVKGTRVHAIAALVVSGKLPKPDRDNSQFMPELQKILKSGKLPDELSTFTEEFKALKKARVLCESEWAFTKDWVPTSWFGHDCWLRIKVDAHYLEGRKKPTVVIIDHKTGKIHEDHALQRSLYALGAFLQYPDAARVKASHWYLDQGEEKSDEWTRDQLEALKTEWLKRTRAMMNDTTFAPNPSAACRWCVFEKAKGGPCVY